MNPFDLPLRNVGVYVGHNLGGPVTGELIYGTMVEETAQYLGEIEGFRRVCGQQTDAVIAEVVARVRDGLPRRGPQGDPKGTTHMGAAIISEALGLNGPAMVLDAACSSALQGLAMAARALQLGRIDMAIVGGASYFHVDSLLLFSAAQSGSAKGCCPFDADADGLVSGEGYAAIAVKTLSRALADGDPIRCVIRGIGVSSDGRGKSLWAPRKEGQVLAIERAYRGGVDIGRLQYIEAHATSTAIGDLTELRAIAEVLHGRLPPGVKIPMGGVKANIGHTLETAGLAGLIKAVLAMQHGTIPQQIHLSRLNPGIDWQQAPFFVPTANTPWPEFEDGHPRRAAVNSFGIGGLNVHVVIDEHKPLPDRCPPAAGTPRPSPTPSTANTAAPLQEPIAIIGAGCVFPGARTLEAFWDLLASGRDPKCEAPADRWNTKIGYEAGSKRPWRSPSKRGGFVTDFQYDWRRHKVPPNQVANADPLQLMILDTTDNALIDAGYDRKPFDKTRVGVVVGTIFGTDFCDQLLMGFRLPDFCDKLGEVLRGRGVAEDQIATISQAYQDVLLKHMPALLDQTGGFTPSTLASRITKTYDFMGGAATVDAGQASSLAALCSAVDFLRDGSCDMVICAAGHRAMGLPMYELLALDGSLADDNPKSPFDAAAGGYLPGEGVGVLVLKRLADAERDGDRVRGIIRGIATGVSSSCRQAIDQALQRAYEAAGVAPEEVTLLETSGVGQPETDDQEIAAVADRMAPVAQSEPLHLGSVVGQIGHTQGASGMASLLAAMHSLDKSEVPAVFGAAAPEPALAAIGPRIQLATTPAPLSPRGKQPRLLAGITSTDSLGAVYHLVLERGTGAQKGAVPFLRHPATKIGTVPGTRLPANQADLGEEPRRPDEHAASGKVAFLFSGQGSQYPGMLKPLIEEFPPAAEAMQQIDAVLRRLNMPAFAEVAWDHPEVLGKDVWLTQLSLLCADTIIFQSLQALAIRPDFVAGHSYGEYPALVAAGAWDFENAVLATRARCQAIESCRNTRGRMLSVAAAGPIVEQLCRQIDGHVCPANYNAPDQTVVGGEPEAVTRLAERLKAEGITAVALPVPRPFHTPLMHDVQEPLARGLQPIRILAPQVPILSSVTNRFATSPEEIRANLVAQMTTPVRYVDLIEQLAGLGVAAMVEVGPRQVLTGLHGKILAGRDVAILACDDKARGGLSRLSTVRADLESRRLLDRPERLAAGDVFAATAESPAVAPAVLPAAEATVPTIGLPSGVLEPAGMSEQVAQRNAESWTEQLRRIARRYADGAGFAGQPGLDNAEFWFSPLLQADSGVERGGMEKLSASQRQELWSVAERVGMSGDLLAAYRVWFDSVVPNGSMPGAGESGDKTLQSPPLTGERLSSPPDQGGATRVAMEPVVPFIPIEEYLAASRSVDGQPPFDNGGRVCSRFVLRMLRTPLPEIEPAWRELNGPAMIVGQNAVGMALRKQVEEIGSKAVIVPISDQVEKSLAAVEKIWRAYQPPHLFLVTPFDDDAVTSLEPADWQRRRHRGVMLPYLICQKWFELISAAKMVERASVVAATAMGGDFGLSGGLESAESGAITGLVKALCIEVGYTTNWAFRTKVIDSPRTEPPEQVAANLLRELRSLTWFAEIGYAAGQRFVIRAIHKPVEAAPHGAPTRGRPWLVTGGARGITAAVAQQLGAKFGVKLHLVGSSPLPEINPEWRDFTPEQLRQLRFQVSKQAMAEKKLPTDAWKRVEKAIEIDRNLRAMAEAGVDAVYHACDVADYEGMARLVDEIRRRDGPIEGVIHGAGIEVASRFTKKASKIVSKTIAAKVDGAAVLMHLTRNDPLRFFFGFGSISGRWGAIGQTDYGTASDMLCKLIDWFRMQRPDCHATCFHWQPWDEIGMAVRDETRGGNVLQLLQLMPPAEGIQFFVDEMLAGAPEPEVLVTDWAYYKRYQRDLSDDEVAKTYTPSVVLPAKETIAPTAATVPCEGRVALRHVMRMVEEPWEAAPRRPFSFAGPAIILGDNPDAAALRKRLLAAGVEVRQIPVRESLEETLADPQWGLTPAPHLFLMTGRDPEAAQIDSREAWLRRRHRGVVVPFMVCRKWLELIDRAKLRSRASLAAATSMGGDFGFAGPVLAPEGGALTGLLKGLFMDFGGKAPGTMPVKIIDAPPDEPPPQVAEAILRELEVEGIDLEVACVTGKRQVVRLVIEPTDQFPRQDIPSGGVWVFTGGARGITAAVAKVMGQRYHLKLHLLGKSPLPHIDPAWRNFDDQQMRQLKRSLTRQAQAEGKPLGTYWDRVRKDLEIDRNLGEIQAAGIKATYHGCDVARWDELADTLQRIRKTDGPIEGIVHGAGIHGPALSLGESDLEILSEMLEVKVDAAMALLLLTRDDPLRYFVGFGSISGRFGTPWATVYTAANDLLCKLIGWQRSHRPGCRAVGFHWHPWGEVGMMTRPVSQHTIKIMKMKMMPPAEGANHLIEELRAEAPESEVLISDSQFYETFYSRDLVISGGDHRIVRGPASRQAAGAQKGTVSFLCPPATKIGTVPGALIERVETREPGRRVSATVRLDPINDPFLREHRLRDKPTLPMVVALEAFAETAGLLTGGAGTVIAVRDVRIADAVRFHSQQTAEVRVHAEIGNEGIACRMSSDFRNRRGDVVQKDRLHFSAVVEVGERPPAAEANAPSVSGDWFEVTYPNRDAIMYHGAPLRLLKRVAIGEDCGWGQLELPAVNELIGGRNAAGWLTPSAAIDACLYACGVYTWLCGDQGVTVPDSLGELRFGRATRREEKAVVHLVCRALQDKFGAFDFTLFGDDGAVIFQASKYRCHILRGGAAPADHPPSTQSRHPSLSGRQTP